MSRRLYVRICHAKHALKNSYLTKPLTGWAISTGAQRPINTIADLKNSKIGVSRIGSGSYVMGFVLADEQGWLNPSSATGPFETHPLQTFAKLRDGVNDSTIDFFMWEHFTSKKYYDNGEIKRVGEIYTPWSSWKIVASSALVNSDADGGNKDGEGVLDELFAKIDQGVEYFNGHHDEAVEFISTQLDYSVEDARAWLETVRFAEGTKGVDGAVIEKTVEILKKAGVLGEEGMSVEEMMISR